MWADILKARATIKVKGDIFRRLLLRHVEETGYQNEYRIKDVLDSIFEEYKRLYLEDIEGKRSGPTWSIQREKLGKNIGRYFPEGYKRQHRTNEMIKLNQQEDLEKIRTSRGDRLRLKDWEAFKKSLRAGLNTIVPRDIYGRKSSVRIVDGEFIDNKATINISFRSLQKDRRYIYINFIEEDGDYYFTTIEGNIQIFDNEVIQTEAQLRERVIDLVEEIYKDEREEYDLRQKEEDELTEEENIRQLEAANPDSYWDREKGKLVQREVIPEDPPARDLNLEEAAKLGRVEAKREEDKQKNLARLRSLKNKLKNLSAHRGNRSRRDVP